jgi:hypothetical protein
MMLIPIISLILGAILFGGWVKTSAIKRGVSGVTFLNSRAILVLGFLLAGAILAAVPFPSSLPEILALGFVALTLDYLCMVLVAKIWWSTSWGTSARVFVGWYLGWLTLYAIGSFVMTSVVDKRIIRAGGSSRAATSIAATADDSTKKERAAKEEREKLNAQIADLSAKLARANTPEELERLRVELDALRKEARRPR